MVSELQNCLYHSFSNIAAAFEYFIPKENRDGDPKNLEIVFHDFIKGLDSLLPKRFHLNELESLWKKINHGAKNMTFEAFSSFLIPTKFLKEVSSSQR